MNMSSFLGAVSSAVELEPGDRFEVVPIGSTSRLSLPQVLGPDGFAIEQIEDISGRTLESAVDLAGNSLIVPKLAEVVAGPVTALWLEYRQPGRFRLIVDAGTGPPAGGEVVTEQGVSIVLEPHDWSVVHQASESPAGLETFDLALQAARLATHAGFDQLISLPLVRDIELLEHQVRTAKTVLRRFRGRAMLCDEVGLGKTIEAGLVFRELKLRGLVKRVLVVAPKGIITQWVQEMKTHFNEEFQILTPGEFAL